MAYHTADRRYELVDVKSWDPKDYGGELPLGIIRDACREAHGRYRLDSLLFDDSSFIDSGQQLADLGVPMSRFHKENPAAQTRRCRLLIEAFRERKILLYDTDPHSKLLIRDLHLMPIVERGADRLYLEKPRDHEGHCDRGDAFSLAIVSVFHAALAKLTPQPMEGPVRVVLA